MRAVTLNPVFARELKQRVQGRRAAVTLTLYLGALTLLVWLIYEGTVGSNSNFGTPIPTQLSEVGSRIFDWVLFVMLLAVLFLVPAQSAGAIAGERERQTLVPLQITLLTPGSILVGKIGASMAFLALLLVAAIPVMSIAYLFGGVTIADVVGGTALVLAVGVCIATMCAAISTFAKRVQSATVMSYGLVLVLLLGTLAAYAGAAAVDRSRGVDAVDPPSVILILNPVATIADLVGSSSGSVDGPLTGLKELMDDASDGAGDVDQGFDRGGVGIAVDVGGPVEFDDGPDANSEVLGVPFWTWSLFFIAGLALLALLLAIGQLRAPAASER